MKIVSKCIVFVCLIFSTLFANDTEKYSMEQNWALGASVRYASSIYKEDTSSVASFLPLMFFENDYVFLNGLDGGIKFYKKGKFHFNGLGRLYFYDIDKQYQNKIQGDNVHFGGQVSFRPHDWNFFDVEPMWDRWGNFMTNINAGVLYDIKPASFRLLTSMKMKTSSYNSFYYGLSEVTGVKNIDGGIELSAEGRVSVHIYRNLYLFGLGKITRLDDNAKSSEIDGVPIVKDEVKKEFIVGFALGNDRYKEKKKMDIRPYVRLAHGWATPSALYYIVRLNWENDEYNNQMTSLFYGHPLSDNLFTLPIHVYLHGGLVQHWKSDVQDYAQEGVASVKLFYTVPLPIRFKLGVAEGLSYINNITYIEDYDYQKKRYEGSNLLNYLDFSVDLSLKDLSFDLIPQELWFGWSIHHRSAIFESSQVFGRIKGGSNYNTLFLRYHF